MYLYIFEDMSIAKQGEPPTKGDLECVDAGILTILCVSHSDICELDGDGVMKSIPSTKQTEFDGTVYSVIDAR